MLRRIGSELSKIAPIGLKGINRHGITRKRTVFLDGIAVVGTDVNIDAPALRADQLAITFLDTAFTGEKLGNISRQAVTY